MFAAAVIIFMLKIYTVQSCKLLTERWIKNTTIPGLEYYISRNDMSFTECKQYCTSLCNNSYQATIRRTGVTPLMTLEFGNVMCITNMTLWILNSKNKNKCFVLYENSINETSSSESKFRCLCQRWNNRGPCRIMKKSIGYLDFYLDYTARTYEGAATNCRGTSNSSIVQISNPSQIINLSKSLELQTGSYWLKSLVATSGRNCLVLNVTSLSSYIQKTDCRKTLYTICSRLNNVSSVLTDPVFVDMINNMTVHQRRTKKARSKENSARDTRLTTIAIGGGLVAMVAVPLFFLVVVSDIQNCFKRKRAQRFKTSIANNVVHPSISHSVAERTEHEERGH